MSDADNIRLANEQRLLEKVNEFVAAIEAEVRALPEPGSTGMRGHIIHPNEAASMTPEQLKSNEAAHVKYMLVDLALRSLAHQGAPFPFVSHNLSLSVSAYMKAQEMATGAIS